MRIAVISDTHGSIDLAVKAVKAAWPVEAVVHLGDFIKDAKKLAHLVDVPVHAVRGDNDPGGGDKEVIVIFEGHPVLATHGHYYNVDMSLKHLMEAAFNHEAEAVLFAHDHKPRVLKKNGILLVNPGTLFIAEKHKTCAILEISPEKLRAEIIELKESSYTKKY
jgi:putative phosphoesterase